MNIRLKIALFIVGLVGLFAFQSKLVMPFVYKVVASDLFMEDTDDPGSQMAVTTNMTQYAFEQCNAYAKEQVDEKLTIKFPKEPIKSWDVGNYEYIINAEIELISPDTATLVRRYACNIRYKNKSDIADVNNPENWSVYGLSGLDN